VSWDLDKEELKEAVAEGRVDFLWDAYEDVRKGRDRAHELEESAKAMTRRLQEDLYSTRGPVRMDAKGRLQMLCPVCMGKHRGPVVAERPATRLPAETVADTSEAPPGPQEPAQSLDSVREELVDLAGGVDLLFADGWDACILGVALVWDSTGGRVDRVVYDMEAMLEQLVDEGASMDEAAEHISFNVEGAYVGEQTPIYVRRTIPGG
jgi:hypothetical protein